MAFTLPDLPYDYNALKPHIDEETMHIHHDKPHQGYERPHVHEWPGGVREHPGRDYSPWPRQ